MISSNCFLNIPKMTPTFNLPTICSLMIMSGGSGYITHCIDTINGIVYPVSNITGDVVYNLTFTSSNFIGLTSICPTWIQPSHNVVTMNATAIFVMNLGTGEQL